MVVGSLMDLRKYLAEQKITHAAFAREVGCKDTTLYRYLKGHRFPRPNMLQRIVHLTQGAVTANDFARVGADRDVA